MKRIKKYIVSVMLSMLTMISILPMQAFAAGNIDTNRDVKLTVSYQDNNTPIVGAEFNIYMVASSDANGKLTVSEDFSKLNVNIQGKNNDELRTLASTLEGYVLRDKISPADSGKTNDKGLAVFPSNGKKLKQGMYLVVGKRHTQNGYYYDATETPDYILNPDMKMPVKKIKGINYIGKLSISSLKLKLPVISKWSYPNLKTAPCRYSGSAYKNNMIICGHNYNSHFGRLKELSEGDKVKFTDIDGNVFAYRVAELEILSPEDTKEVKKGRWDLTLFTCTVGGQERVTVRLELE